MNKCNRKKKEKKKIREKYENIKNEKMKKK